MPLGVLGVAVRRIKGSFLPAVTYPLRRGHEVRIARNDQLVRHYVFHRQYITHSIFQHCFSQHSDPFLRLRKIQSSVSQTHPRHQILGTVFLSFTKSQKQRQQLYAIKRIILLCSVRTYRQQFCLSSIYIYYSSWLSQQRS